MSKPVAKPRRVRALRKCYVEHVVRREGEVFTYSGPPAPTVFLELDQGDTSPVSSNVPRVPGDNLPSKQGPQAEFVPNPPQPPSEGTVEDLL